MLNLWYNDKTRMYYSPSKFDCVNCHSEVYGYMLLATFWDKKESWQSTYCKRCFRKISQSSMISERKLVILGKPPENSVPVLQRPPSFADSRLSVYDLAKIEQKYPGAKTVDRRRYMPVLDGTEQIGRPDMARMELMDQPANEQTFKKLIWNEVRDA